MTKKHLVFYKGATWIAHLAESVTKQQLETMLKAFPRKNILIATSYDLDDLECETEYVKASNLTVAG